VLRKALRIAALIAGVAVLYVALTTFEVWRVGRDTTSARFDAIVVMGAAQYDGRPSPQLAARLDHVVELWNLGVAPRVVVTGGNQPGDRFTEASASKDYLVERGVPAAAIAEESQSRSTWEAFANLRFLVDDSTIDVDNEAIVIVTDPFHSLRSRLIAEENGFAATTSATATSPVDGSSAMTKHLKEGVGVAIGRIIGFRWLWKVTG
jgi:uncharacterized SAM-binding protein YcdF (DUF218 family)